MKYFLYARKSTDEEERQVLSISAQLAELKEFAAKEKLEIAASFEEAKTAKQPGRTVFAEMLNRLEKGEANGILAWHPDRLARNSIDGGKIIYMVDIGQIKSLKFPCFWFEDTPQGKFMLNIAFGQSKYYVDNLSENVKRGQRQKLRIGVWPGWAPFGYANCPKTRNILIDPNEHKIAQRIFELYATGEYSFADLINKFKLTSHRGKIWQTSVIQAMLKNPFYYGVMKYNGELYEAVHEPIISKELHDKCQTVMQQRAHKRRHNNFHHFAFTGFMNCGICGCSITAEKQKGHVYYHCTKKRAECDGKYVREEDLVEQFRKILESYSLPDADEPGLLKFWQKDFEESIGKSSKRIKEIKAKVEILQTKLDHLLDAHLEGVVDKEAYLPKKESLLKEKFDLEQEMVKIEAEGDDWLEPCRDFILASVQAKKIAWQGDLELVRSFLKKIGSNFILEGKKFVFLAKNGWRAVSACGEFRDSWVGKDSNLRSPKATDFTFPIVSYWHGLYLYPIL